MKAVRRGFSASAFTRQRYAGDKTVHHSFNRKPRYDPHANANVDASLKQPLLPFRTRHSSQTDIHKPFYPYGTPLAKPLVFDGTASVTPAPIEPSTWTSADKRVGVLAIKRGMMAWWDPEFGQQMPVTVLQLNAATVVGRLVTPGADNEYKLLVGSGRVDIDTDETLARFSEHVKLCRAAGLQHVCEHLASFPVTPGGLLPLGTRLHASHFLPGQLIDTRSRSKNKGFQGVMKRWNFKGQGASHGTSLSHRSGGSIGQRKDPGKVWKGKKMAGQMGDDFVTVKRLQVVNVDPELDLLFIKGTIPGPKGAVVKVRDTIYQADQFDPYTAPPPFPTSIVNTIPSTATASGGRVDPLAVRYNLLNTN